MALPHREPDEIRALSRLAFDELRAAAGGIASVHQAIAQRAFRAVGPGASTTQATHDAISGGVYAAVRGATALIGTAADVALSQGAAPSGRRLSTSAGGGAVLGVLNGLIGDRLELEDSDLQEPMGVRVGGRLVPPEPETLASAFGRATPRLVVFVHGLMETENAWRLGAGESGETYGDRLARDLDYTPIFIRYNTGRHVSTNGRSLAELIEALVAAWPLPVERIAIVGHSMGGLVARSGCWQGSKDGARWVRSVRHVVSLGTPHMGAPLEQGVHLASAALHAVPETRPLGALLRRRSAGIRDLHQGSLVDEDWRDCDPDALRKAACREVPLLEGASHCFVAATVTRSPTHPIGRLVGDWLVLESSASGRSRTRRIPFKVEHGMHLGGAHHLALLNHPAVYERLREWLAAEPA
jgi:pimeloyl-ACP methyl ester carboxylesterase